MAGMVVIIGNKERECSVTMAEVCDSRQDVEVGKYSWESKIGGCIDNRERFSSTKFSQVLETLALITTSISSITLLK
jgi:hypothetical protein